MKVVVGDIPGLRLLRTTFQRDQQRSAMMQMKHERLSCVAAAVTAQTLAAKRLQSPPVLGPFGSCRKPICAFRKVRGHPGNASLKDLHDFKNISHITPASKMHTSEKSVPEI